MNRCISRTLMAPVLLALLTLTQVPVQAQSDDADQAAQAGKRQFPKSALRGEMVVAAPPEILIDNRAERLSPGARIRDTQNHMVLMGAYLNQKVVVNYVRDNMGQISEVWVLTAEEARDKRTGWLETIINYTTGSTPPPSDDGKTPYNQLPAYRK